MLQKLLVATHNSGKKNEIAELLKDLNIEVLFFGDLDQAIEEPEETGTTYEENALLKARNAAEITGLPTIGDDSGLEVEMLPDELGVQTKRYAPGTDEDRNTKLLDELRQEQNRTATFVCCVVLYDPQTSAHKAFFGEVQGKIAEEPKGGQGFGFDPVFIPDGYDKTMAELGPEIKNTLSHRARAVEKLKAYLQQ